MVRMMNFDDGAMLPHMSQAFTVCRLHLLEHGIQCGVPFTVTFHLEREASVHTVHLSGMSLVSPVFHVPMPKILITSLSIAATHFSS